jgi:hypothetical protein
MPVIFMSRPLQRGLESTVVAVRESLGPTALAAYDDGWLTDGVIACVELLSRLTSARKLTYEEPIGRSGRISPHSAS